MQALRAYLVLISTLVVLGSHETLGQACFQDPSQSQCAVGSTYYTELMISEDLARVCDAKPWMSGCSVRAECASGAAEGQYCESWSLLASICTEERSRDVQATSEGCRRYVNLCLPATGRTVVQECTAQDLQAVPKLLSAMDGAEDMVALCREMPDMIQCESCTGLAFASCPNPLKSISGICLDHYMTDCNRWYEMCTLRPVGLTPFCGEASERGAFETVDSQRCFGIMRMYFHTGFDDYVLFKSWVPCNAGGYAFTFIVILLIGIINAFIKALRTRQEQAFLSAYRNAVGPCAYMSEDGRSESGKSSIMSLTRRACRHVLPRSSVELRQNAVRSCFTFVTMLLDYALMLIAMTFNVGLFIAVILGIALGTLIFGHTIVPLTGDDGSSDGDSNRGGRIDADLTPPSLQQRTEGEPPYGLGPREVGAAMHAKEQRGVARMRMCDMAAHVSHSQDMSCCSHAP